MRSLLGLALLKTASAAITMGVYYSASCTGSPTGTMLASSPSCALLSGALIGVFQAPSNTYLSMYSSGSQICTRADQGYGACSSASPSCWNPNTCYQHPSVRSVYMYFTESSPPPSSLPSSASSDNTFLYVVIAVLCVALLGGGGYLVAKSHPSPSNSPVAPQQVELQSTTSGGGYDMRPIEGLPFPPTATVTHVAPAPKFDPNTGEPIVPASPDPFANARRFDDNTGEPIPKFNPNTGERNW